MTFATKDGLFSVRDGCVVAILVSPRQCECGRMVAIGVNRDGKTRCTECDSKYIEQKKTA